VLGDKKQVREMLGFISKPWLTKERYKVSNAAFGMSWIRDQSAVDQLTKLATSAGTPEVRGMAVIALGYLAARDRVCPLTRCFEETSYRNHFGNWDPLYRISRIL